MTFVPVLNTAEFTLQFAQHDGSFAENVFWVKRSAAWTSADLLVIAAALKTWYGTGDGSGNDYRNLQNDNTSLVAIGGRDFTTQDSATVVYTTGLPIAGTNEAANVTLGLTWALTARTGLAGRSFRGRTFLVDPCAALWATLDDNIISSTLAASAVAAFDALITSVTAADADCSLVVCSRQSNKEFRAEGVTTPTLNYGYHNLISDFQRRRAPAHNRHH